MSEEQQTVELFENRCCVCYVLFWQIKGGRLRRTCSAACRQALYRMRRGEREKKERKRPEQARIPAGTGCPVCGGPMPQPEHGRKRKTCSQGCRMKRWRQQHPRCIVCGKRFTMAKYQKEQKYCSKQCRWQAVKLQQRQRAREKAWAEVAGYRPEWLPREGSGYREEAIPWEGDEEEAVIRERKPHPNYLVTPEEKEAKHKAEEEKAKAEWLAQIAEWEREARRAEETRRLTHDLLFDESKWRDW